MKVLVTGGAGFIGSHLCDAIIDNGGEVVCLDNFLTGFKKNIEHLLENPNFKLIEGDIRNIDVCRNAMEGCTHVCHQAALGSVPRSVADPLTSNEINIGGTLNIYFSAFEAGIKRVVFASSSSCYGDESSLPKMEHKIGKPLSPYAITKVCDELYASVFQSLYEMEMIGLRYFNVFGPRQDPDGMYAAVIPKFVKSLIQLKPPQIFGDGEQSRDFTYIENVVQMNLKALTTESKEATGINYNVACGMSVTVNELFINLREHLAKINPEIATIKPEYVKPRPGDILHSLANIDLAKNNLDYNPEIMFPLGISKAIDWYWKSLQ